MPRRTFFHAAALAAAALAAAHCSVIVDSELAPGGLGAACTQSSECQAGSCDANGLCTAACSSNADCPAPTACFAGSCQRPLRAAALWVGVAAGGEGWTLTHDQGMQDAAASLPYLTWTKKENVVSEADIGLAIDEFVAGGADVIVANSFSQRDATLKKAEEYPGVKFLVCQSYKSNGKNADSYAAHGEQAWWIAGKVAGTKAIALGSQPHRLGFVGSFITPETVRHVAAFYLGARSVDPTVTLEVQWMGFWSDLTRAPQFEYTVKAGHEGKGETAGETKRYFYEQLLARRLIDHGATVVAHGADNQRVVKLVDDLAIAGVSSVSNDNPNAFKALAAQPDGESLPTGAPLATCLGSPYWNWGPQYVEIFSEMHRNVWDPTASRNAAMTADLAASVVGFNLNPAAGVDDSIVKGFANDIAAAGWQSIYAGPYPTTGQRDRDGDGANDPVQAVDAGDTLTEEEWQRMCWFPRGIVERIPADSDDAATEVPAQVPDATFEADPRRAAQRAEMTTAAFPGLSFNCNANR
jgi:basic membrane lipoprotein Med (substrate-binding protein (PBP1-ABC) superfamily)